MTKEKLISKLISEDCNTIEEWILCGEYENLFEFIRSLRKYETWDKEDLLELSVRQGIGLL